MGKGSAKLSVNLINIVQCKTCLGQAQSTCPKAKLEFKFFSNPAGYTLDQVFHLSPDQSHCDVLAFSHSEKKHYISLVENLVRKKMTSLQVHVINVIRNYKDNSRAGFLDLSGCSEIHCLSGGRGQTATL